MLFGAGMFAFFMLVPELASVPEETGVGFGASPTEASLFLLPLAVVMVACSPLSTRIVPQYGPRGALVTGFLLMGGSLLFLTELHSEPWHVHVVSAVFGAGSGLGVAALTNAIVEVVAIEQTGVATGVNTLSRLVGQGIGGQLAASILALHALPSGVPLEQGFVIGLGAGSATLFAGAAVSAMIPGSRPSTKRLVEI
jgi:predicted MFS family arabinose efflux permease